MVPPCGPLLTSWLKNSATTFVIVAALKELSLEMPAPQNKREGVLSSTMAGTSVASGRLALLMQDDDHLQPTVIAKKVVVNVTMVIAKKVVLHTQNDCDIRIFQ